MVRHIKYKHILWDWNGTLFDDVDASIASINVSLKNYNLPLLDRERYFDIFCFPVEKYYERLGFDLEKTNYQQLAQEFIDNYLIESSKSASMQPYAIEVLKHINKLKIEQSILSASEKQILVDKLDFYSIAKYFADIIALDNIYAESKLQIGMEWIKERNNKEEIVLVGDSPHDYEVAKEMGIDCILFAGGHGCRKDLIMKDATIIDTLCQLKNHLYVTEESAVKVCKGD